MPEEAGVELVVNGEPRQHRPGDPATLVDFLRERLGLTGTKLSCGAGFCGACTVLVDGVAVSSCSVLVADLPGAQVTTIEGLCAPQCPHPVQAAFVAEAGFQCGFCTPGMIMTAVALLREHPTPSAAQIREYLEGNLCRCTGYASIIAAVQRAAGDSMGSPC